MRIQSCLRRLHSAALVVALAAPAARGTHDGANPADAVQRLLAAPANGSPAPVRLRSASVLGSRITLDFSGELAALGLGSAAFEAFLRPLHRAAVATLPPELSSVEIITLIEGVPLDRLLEPPAPRDRPATAALVSPPAGIAPSVQPLHNRRIALSPGHGYYFNGNAFVLQRSYWQGIVEDFVNHDFVTHLQSELLALGADVQPTRNLDRAAGNGESGFPKWQEAARYHVKALGAAESVWNEPNFTHLEQDIRCRPRYANAIEADILVSIHNNGAGTPGAGTGTETLYDTSNASAAESRRLADLVHGRVISAIRRAYHPTWSDRRVQGFNGSYGENRLATRPSVILEIAFMDRPTPDNAALQDDRFKRLVAAAIRDGIQEYFEGPTVPPAPSALVAATGVGAISLSWRDNADTETGFRLERRSTAANAAWATLAVTGPNVTVHTDPSASAGASYVYRVVAFNARGDSAQASNEVTATPAAPGARPAAWLANLSVRTTLAAAQRVIVGVVVSGGTREVLLRGAGPALVPLGVATAMPDPRLEVFRGQAMVDQNDDWADALAPVFTAVGAFPFVAGSRDAALLQSLGGAHTVQASGPNGGTVLVEGYDAATGGDGWLVNLSSRNRVGTGADVLIAGFHIAGTGVKRVLIRGIGPGLAALGVPGTLADPRLDVFDPTGAIVESNDNWDSALAATFASVGAFALPTASRDAAVVVALEAGRGYTAQVSGVAGTTGEALVEIYELP